MKKTSSRQVLARNLHNLMKRSESLRTQEQLAAKSGIGQTTVSLMLRPGADTIDANKLDTIEKAAGAFELEAWQLLLNEETVGDQLFSMLMRPRTAEGLTLQKAAEPERAYGSRAFSPEPQRRKRGTS